MINNDVEKIIVFDTSIASDNIGDEIIMRSVYNEMRTIFDPYFIMKHSTHTPIMHLYQQISKADPAFSYYSNAKYKFIGGSNIFKRTIRVRRSDWNINIFDKRFYDGAITIGCGSSFDESLDTDSYTKKVYGSFLNRKYYHSTRDEKTKVFLETLGYKAINTGCVTLWSITPELCKSIPIQKSEKVVFTLTGYKPDPVNDKKMVEILASNYKELFFWPQSIGDLEYFHVLMKDMKSIPVIILEPNLYAYERLLSHGDVEYVGTRLHGGIFALQNRRRATIISIDNRAEDMDVSNNINCIKREKIIDELEKRVNGNIVTDIHVDNKAIEDWKGQFVEI